MSPSQPSASTIMQGILSLWKQPAESLPGFCVLAHPLPSCEKQFLHFCHSSNLLRQSSPPGRFGITAWHWSLFLPGTGPCQQEQGQCQACHHGCAKQFHCSGDLRMLEPAWLSLKLMPKTLEGSGHFLTASCLQAVVASWVSLIGIYSDVWIQKKYRSYKVITHATFPRGRLESRGEGWREVASVSPAFKLSIHHFQAEWPWTSYMIILILNFLTYKIGVTMVSGIWCDCYEEWMR